MPIQISRRHLMLTTAALAVLPLAARAATPPVFMRDGIAIGGSDPVAYFSGNGPVQGSPEFTHAWNGATWHFASAANRDAFVADPPAFAPQYGGYCAYAVSRNYTASTDPRAWTLQEGRLYLNFSRPVRLLWSADIPGNISKADANWPSVLQ